jgi:leucyl-tRNA synthetase
MVFVRDIGKLDCHKRSILEPFLIALSPFAPHFCEELMQRLGHTPSVLKATFPEWKEEYLLEDMDEYPVQVNGKMRGKISAPAGASKEEVERIALADENVQRHLEGKAPRKVIVNVVV